MKALATIMVVIIAVNATISQGAELLKVLVKPSEVPFTSESVQFTVVFTNICEKAISVLKPVVGDNMSICVYDKTGDELARSRTLPKERFKNVQPEHILLNPFGTWESEPYELLSIVYPVFRVVSNRNARIELTYSIDNKKYVVDYAKMFRCYITPCIYENF